MKTINFLLKISIALSIFGLLIHLSSCYESNQKPKVWFDSPENHTVITSDTTLLIKIGASDEDGGIQNVQLYIGDSLMRTFNEGPYEYEWQIKNSTDSVYLIKAIVFDNKGASTSASIYVEYQDYRSVYFGNFYFRTVCISWVMDADPHYDTTYYHGIIRQYISGENSSNANLEYESEFNESNMITINHKENMKITTEITEEGVFINKYGHHYTQSGKFFGTDTIQFFYDGLSGMGGGTSYKVFGIRE